jgi:hypothetical protein
MDLLIEQLKSELKISETEAIDLVRAITEYIENQHPLLKDIAQDILEREIKKIKNV